MQNTSTVDQLQYLFTFPFNDQNWKQKLGIGFLFLILSVIMPAAVGHTIVNAQVGAAFRVREWWPIFRANLGGYLITTILLLGTMMFLSYSIQLLYMTIVLCCLLPVLTGFMYFYVGIISNVMYGQAYRIGRDALPFKPDNLTSGIDQDDAASE